MKRYIHDLEASVDLSCGGKGVIVLHSTCEGTSSGGVRIASAIDVAEVRAMAREMSLKLAFSGLARGGAKAGIALPESLHEEARLEALREFGTRIRPLVHAGVFYPGMDMNCGARELKAIYAGCDIRLNEVTDTPRFTAMTVAQALIAYRAQTHDGSAPTDLLIEGFGSVARHLLSLLSETEFRIIGISTERGAAVRATGYPFDILRTAQREAGDALVSILPQGKRDRSELFDAQAHVLLPSARTMSITCPRASRVDVAAVIPIANAPYAAGALELLHARGVMCLSSICVNNGGVFASSLFDVGMPESEVLRFCERIYRPVLERLLIRGRETGCAPAEIAESVASRYLLESTTDGSQLLLRRMRHLLVRRLLPRRLYATRFLSHLTGHMNRLKADLESWSRI